MSRSLRWLATTIAAAWLASPEVHTETIKYASGADSIAAYIAYPSDTAPVPGVIVIHGEEGISDLERDATKRLAQKGYVALAPDFLSRRGGAQAAAADRKLVTTLNRDTITRDLDAAVRYLQSRKDVNGSKIGVIGFSWGGSESFRYATNNPSLRAFVVCYGTGPDLDDLKRIKASGFGVYADRDGRINQGLYNLLRIMRKDSVEFTFQTYTGTGHGFMQEPPSSSKNNKNKTKPVDDAWRDIFAFLEARLR